MTSNASLASCFLNFTDCPEISIRPYPPFWFGLAVPVLEQLFSEISMIIKLWI